MELANENLLVLRQAKALVIFGKVAAEFGDVRLAHDILDHAIHLAADSQFRLVEGDAREALAELNVGGPIETGKPF
jgi:Cdc6-like AAA superfamily ATPase